MFSKILCVIVAAVCALCLHNVGIAHAQSCCPGYQICDCTFPHNDCCDVWSMSPSVTTTNNYLRDCVYQSNTCIIGNAWVTVVRENCSPSWSKGVNCLASGSCNACSIVTQCTLSVTVTINGCFYPCTPDTAGLWTTTRQVLCQ